MYDQASYSTEAANAPSQILAGGNYTTRKLIITGGAALVAGTVLGPVLAAASATVTVGTPIAGAGGTIGNGTIGDWTTDAGAMEGQWYLEVTATGDTGKYKVVRPDGTVEGVGTIGTPYNGELNGTLGDGSNNWLVGDLIPITVAYDWDEIEYKKSVAAATDGSQHPRFVLAQDADASAGDVEAIAYETGQIVGSALTLGAGHTITSIREGLLARGLVIDD